MNFTYDGLRKDWILATRISRPYRSNRRLNIIKVTGHPGGYLESVEKDPLNIPVRIEISGKNQDDYFDKVEELVAWFEVTEPKPLVFDDRPNRTYYAVVEGTLIPDEIVQIGYVDILFVCLDPDKYGPEQSFELQDIDVVENQGTAAADPIFELTAKEKTTFAMVSNADDEYNLIGTPADDDVETVDTKTSVLYENGSTIDTWNTATLDMIDKARMPKVAGSMTTDDAGIRARNYGTGDKLHGPAVFKEINPIQDFEIETTFDIISRRERENFRMGINFLDENMNILGHIGIKDNSRNYKRRVPLARYGPYRGGGRSNGNLIGDSKKNDRARETTLFYLRAKRESNTFDFYIGEWQSRKHIRHWHETYHDVNNEYSGKLKYISLYIASYADRVTPSRLRMNSVEVFELAQTTEDQTPYILYPNDVVTFDHENEDILVNGEPRKDLKDFGGSFFTLKRGFNSLIVTPEDSFDTSVKFKDKFLS